MELYENIVLNKNVNNMTEQPTTFAPPEEADKGIEDDWEFTIISVADLIALKISPKEFLPSAEIAINLSWTHMIALINRKSKDEKRINTKVSAQDLFSLYGKLMGTSFF